MKLLDILQEAVTEYKVSYIVLKNKNVSKGSASYKDLADASKFFDSLTKDPELYSARLEKIFGADSSSDIGGAKYMGGKETIVYYTHPATKGRSQGGKKFDELTPDEQDIRTFANSRLDQQEKLGFTGDIGFSMNEERTSTISKKRASAELKQKLKGTRSDGMGKYTATIYGMDGDERVKLKDMNDLNKYSKFELAESVNEDINYDEFDEKPKDFKSLLELGAKATKLMGEDKLIEISDAFEERGDEQSDRIASHLNMAIELIQDGESKSATSHLKKFNKECREALRELGESVNEGMSKEVLYSQIRDIIDSLDSGESDGIPLDNETEMLLQQELRRLRGMLKSMKESTSLEEIYTQISEAKNFGFFSNEEGSTGNSIVSEAFDDYEMAVERAFQNLINKVNTAINIGGSGGTDTEVREMVMYHFDKIQDQITTTDLINSTFRK
tara:strand:- start:14726 stop:16057 length:1332 start_codon:yes stop_codon:yes gene_type:complete